MRLLDTLRTARREHDWDLAVLCIDTCGQSIERVAAANHVAVERQPNPVPTATSTTVSGALPLGPVTTAQHASSGMQFMAEGNDLHFSLDIPWDHLWDDVAEPWGLLDQY